MPSNPILSIAENSINSTNKDKAKQKKKHKQIVAELELASTIRLMGGLYISRSAYQRLKSNFEGVVVPSLISKAYGRLAIICGWIAHTSFKVFILSSLMFAPQVALIAGVVRFAYVLVKELRAKKRLSVALKMAAKESIKTTAKFFIVYMAWTLAIALAMHLAILSGPLLPVGILLVAVITSLGFILARFLVEKLPKFLVAPKKAWAKFKEKLHDLKSSFLPGLMEGASWTLMDNKLVSISSHIVGIAGKFVDIVAISLVVPLMFFIGAIIHASIKRWLNSRKQSKVMVQREQLTTAFCAIKEVEQPQAIQVKKAKIIVKEPQKAIKIILAKQQDKKQIKNNTLPRCRFFARAADKLKIQDDVSLSAAPVACS